MNRAQQVVSIFGVVGVVMGVPLAAFAKDTAEADKAAIIAAEQRMCGMTNMSQTVNDTIGFYDKNVVQFDIMPEVFEGQAAVRESLARQYANVKNMTCQMNKLHVGVNGDLGYAFSVQSYEAEGVRGGPYSNAALHSESATGGNDVKVQMTWRQTDIWKKTDGKWTMIHQHSSFPIDIKSGKPVMDPR